MPNPLRRHYEKIIEELSVDTETRYRDFLLRQPRTRVRGNLVIDAENLDRYFDCQGCRRRHPRAFCCASHELELTGQDLAALEAAWPAVSTQWPRLSALARKSGGFFGYGENFEQVMTQKKSGECLFLMPGGDGCYLHLHALESGQDPIDVKPYICSLYPVVVVVIGEQVVVTTLNEHSAKILETGENTRSCLVDRGRPENHVLVRSRDILIRMFGARAFRAMQDAVGK